MYNASESYGGSLGLFLDASDGDSLTSRDMSFVPGWSEDHGFTESGVSKECYIEISGTSNGGYPYMYGEGGEPSDYMPIGMASIQEHRLFLRGLIMSQLMKELG